MNGVDRKLLTLQLDRALAEKHMNRIDKTLPTLQLEAFFTLERRSCGKNQLRATAHS